MAAKKLSKKALNKSFWLWFHGHLTCFTYEHMQTFGYMCSMLPLIEELYDSKEEQKEALTTYSSFFNTEPQLGGSLVVGVTAGLEEARANGEEVDGDLINGIRAGLMGPLAGIGDSIVVGTLIPLLLGIALSMSTNGSPLGAVFYIVAWNLISVLGMRFLYYKGYNLGEKAVALVVGETAMAIREAIIMVGTIVIGAVAGLLVVFGVWLLDYKLHIDDPVGAVAVHCMNGIWGTIATGLFATTSAPGNDSVVGLFYGGGFRQLGLQLLGFVSVAAWTAVTITIAFLIIKATVGLRVSEEEEIVGLDSCEHGLPSAYAGFSIMDISNTMTMEVNENTSLGVSDYDTASAAMKEAAVKVETVPAAIPATGIYKVVVIAKLARFEVLKKALNDLGVTGMTMTQVMGCGVQKGAGEMYRGVEMDATLLPKVKVEVVVSKIPVATVIEAAKKALYTGHIGDGKIFVYNVDKVVKVRTGEEDFAALQDVE